MTNRSTPCPPGCETPAMLGSSERRLLEDDARQRGHTVVVVPLAGCRDKAELLRRASTAFRFPDWFGHNWDALADSLADLSWLDAPGYLVILEAPDDLIAAAPAVWRTLCEVLQEACADRAASGVAWRHVLAPPCPQQ